MVLPPYQEDMFPSKSITKMNKIDFGLTSNVFPSPNPPSHLIKKKYIYIFHINPWLYTVSNLNAII